MKSALKRKGGSLIVYAVLAVAAGFMFKIVPPGFVPPQDKGYLIGFAQLPDAASLDRTDAVIRKMSDIAKEIPGVDNSISFPGLSINGFTNAPNAGIVFVGLKPFDQRTKASESAEAIAGEINKRMGSIEGAFVLVLSPPPVSGLGTTGGFKLMIEDRDNLGYDALYKAIQAIQMKAWQNPKLAGVFSSYQINVPQLFADIDRAKASNWVCRCRRSTRPCRSTWVRCT